MKKKEPPDGQERSINISFINVNVNQTNSKESSNQSINVGGHAPGNMTAHGDGDIKQGNTVHVGDNFQGNVVTQDEVKVKRAYWAPHKRRALSTWCKRLAIAMIFFVAGLPGAVLVVLLPEQENGFSVVRGYVTIKLPDGTEVTVKKGSVLRYAEKGFGADCRDVYLEGEASFDVKPNTHAQFVIHLSDGKILKFSSGSIEVEHSQDIMGATSIQVAARGGVTLFDRSGVVLGRFLRGDEVTYRLYTGDVKVRKKREDAVDNVNFLNLDELTLVEAAQRLEEELNVQITVDTNIQHCRIQATFEKEGLTITQALDAIGVALPGMRYHSFKGGDGKILRVEITGRNCDVDIQHMPDRAVQ